METIKGFKSRLDNWDGTFMLMAISAGIMSHCTRYQVGCVIVKDRRPLVMGINGTSSGHENCDDLFDNPPLKGDSGYEGYKQLHGEWSMIHEQHAEANAIAWASRSGIRLEDSTAYLTLSPCIHCAKQLQAAGIIRVVYLETYDRDTNGIDFLKNSGVDIDKLDKKKIITTLNRADGRIASI